MSELPDIHIIPIKKLYSVLSEADIANSVAIIASSYEVNSEKIPIPHVVEYFDDLDMEVHGRSLSLEQAKRYADFIKGLDKNIRHIYCCCQSAQSRSAAIASALYRYHGDEVKAAEIWQDPEYSPNPYVFLLLCEALGIVFEDVELDALIEANRQALRKAIQCARNLNCE